MLFLHLFNGASKQFQPCKVQATSKRQMNWLDCEMQSTQVCFFAGNPAPFSSSRCRTLSGHVISPKDRVIRCSRRPMSFSDCSDSDGHVIIVALLAAIAGTAPVLILAEIVQQPRRSPSFLFVSNCWDLPRPGSTHAGQVTPLTS